MHDSLEFTSEETVIDLNKDDINGVGLFRLYLMNCTKKTWDHYINDMIKEVDEQYKFSGFLAADHLTAASIIFEFLHVAFFRYVRIILYRKQMDRCFRSERSLP